MLKMYSYNCITADIKIRCNRKSQIFAKTAVIRKFVKRALCAVTYERIKSFIECFIYTSNIQH